MPAFRFALQAAFDAALARERTLAVSFARAREALETSSGALMSLEARSGEARSMVTASSFAGSSRFLDASTLIAADWYLDVLGPIRARRVLEVASAAAFATTARERFGLARRRRFAFARMRERLLAEHRRRGAVREAAEDDESNAVRVRAAHAWGGSIVGATRSARWPADPHSRDDATPERVVVARDSGG
jgi:flagellar biosynthesis chaperone FliJ